MKKLTMLLTMLLACVMAYAQAETGFFSANSTEGVTISYKHNGDGKSCTVAVPDGAECAINKNTTGKVTIPVNVNGILVTAIEESAFSGCTGLTEVTLPMTLLTLGSGAFEGCTSLSKIAIPEGVIEISPEAFKDCTGLKSVTFGSKLTTIGEEAFKSCSSLASIEIPATVTSIEEGAFVFCSGLKTLTVNWMSPLNINSNVFIGTPPAGQTNINFSDVTLRVPQGSKSIYSSATVWKEFKKIEENEAISGSMIINFEDENVKNVCIANWDTSKDGELSVDEARAVTALGRVFSEDYNVRRNCRRFNELRYFTGLKKIADNAFYDCDNLESIELPSSIESIGEGAFSYCNKLTTINIPSKVSSIGDGPFRGSYRITSIVVDEGNAYFEQKDGNLIRKSDKKLVTLLSGATISNNVEIIGSFALCGISNIVSLTIPEGVKTIEYFGLYDCTGMQTLSLPQSLEVIGARAFESCYQLREVIIPAKVNSIGERLFAYCNNLTSVKVDADNTVYDSRDNCNAIIEKSTNKLVAACNATIIPETVTTIGTYAFCGCSNIAELIIPSSVTKIESLAFSDSEISVVKVPWKEEIVDIGNYGNTFKGSTLYVPKGTISEYQGKPGWGSFGSIKDSEGDAVGDAFFVEIAAGVKMWFRILNVEKKTCEVGRILPGGSWTSAIVYDEDFVGDYWSHKEISVPEKAKDYTVVQIGNRAFDWCTNLETIKLPNTIKSIQDMAFYGCQSLTSLTIPASVDSIGKRLFGYTRLQSLVVEDDNPKYESRNCNAIIETSTNKLVSGCSTTDIPTTVEEIGEYAFYYLGDLTTMVIPNSVTTIGSRAFYCCSNLNKLELPNGLKTIPSYLIVDCSRLSSLTIPSSVRRIENDAFVRSSLISVEIPEGVETLGYRVFENSSKLSSVTISSTVKEIGSNLFAECPEMSVIKIADDNEAYQSIGNNTIVEKATGLLKAICHRGASLTIPDSVKIVGNGIFNANTDVITSVTLPSSLKEISSSAFWSCINLSSVTMLNPDPIESVGYWSFPQNTSSQTTLYVPELSVESYQASSMGNIFFAIKPIPEVPGDISGTGHVEAQDVVLWVESFINERLPTDPSTAAFRKFDVNKDNEIDASDLVSIVYLACGYDADGEWHGVNASRSMMAMAPGTLLLKTISADNRMNRMELVLQSPEDYTAFQMDIVLPQEAAVKVNMGERGSGLKLVSNRLPDGRLRVLGFSFSNQALEAGDGQLLTIDVSGSRSIDFSKVRFSTRYAKSVAYTVQDQTTGITGINTDEADTEVFDLNGQRTEKLHKGLNILRDGKGSVRKVFVK